ncbi:MAG: type II CAAX endopeptidase family protein [Candidatus Faecousia sp.]|nr:type II CAAX endopeptidase family protein [Candidatus Faecousia sp.]
MNNDFLPRPDFMIEAGEQKKVQRPLFMELLIFLAVYVVACFIQSMVLTGPSMAWVMTGERHDTIMEMAISGNIDFEKLFSVVLDMPEWFTALSLFASGLLIPVAMLYCNKLEKRSLRSMGFVKDHAVTEYLLGIVVGLAMFAAAFGICAAFGGVEITELTLRPDSVPMLLLMLLAFLIQGAGEEVLLRGYLTVSLSKGRSLPLCIAVSSVVFALLHTPNAGFNLLAFVNIVLVGVFFALYMVKRGNLWGACAVHGMWNFVQGNFFGLPVSGVNAGTSVFQSAFHTSNTLITGGEFGLEASLPVTMVLVAAIGVICATRSRGVTRRAPAPAVENGGDGTC